MCQQQSPETQAVMQYVLQKLNQFVEMLGVDTFAGFTSSTAVTALMATVQQQLVSAPATGTVSSEQLSRSLLRGAISRLLQTAKPHKMLQHRFAGSGLPQEYLNHFINTQPHFSFKAWLTCLLTGDLGSLGQCMPLSGDATMLHPEASTASKKWVVSTNTCASIAMLPQGESTLSTYPPHAAAVLHP